MWIRLKTGKKWHLCPDCYHGEDPSIHCFSQRRLSWDDVKELKHIRPPATNWDVCKVCARAKEVRP